MKEIVVLDYTTTEEGTEFDIPLTAEMYEGLKLRELGAYALINPPAAEQSANGAFSLGVWHRHYSYYVMAFISARNGTVPKSIYSATHTFHLARNPADSTKLSGTMEVQTGRYNKSKEICISADNALVGDYQTFNIKIRGSTPLGAGSHVRIVGRG